MSETVARFSFHDCFWISKLIIETDKTFAVGIVALNVGIDSIESIMISAFAIFRLVVDRRAFYLNFSCREIALEVFHVSGCIPQAPFCKREYLERFHFFGIIFERHLLYLSPSVERNEEEPDIYADQGRYDLAVENIKTCLLLCESNDEYYYQFELLRFEALYLSKGANPKIEESAIALEKAKTVAFSQGIIFSI